MLWADAACINQADENEKAIKSPFLVLTWHEVICNFITWQRNRFKGVENRVLRTTNLLPSIKDEEGLSQAHLRDSENTF
ncbi:hypothetical protein BDP81DRAFT_425103 [Colletotrichum phormii]|uniref:Heterokaryon incompatibility domain-containing protein n=1 Tax=Colletotrichum phormii TaxID=359342 RepID=A0AAI9ZUR7_9PEZI|nr:uncharacterized protein BDP81DRAFT_425103 [Colletotrichum phormii]KAK1638503.1 hypothetical protein BDP81DRAFT_425103 [Colletotrichum phormii]